MTDQQYMHRCLELARKGAGKVAPNPMVGAVLVHNERIIGEGYHRQYGKAHAEVNCIDSVAGKDRELIASATLYVSLEPCAHFGKTPPCSDLIIRHAIPRVVIGCRDPFPLVNGKGLEKLREAGVETVVNVLEEACKQVNRRFFTFVQQKRPYIILKWAQTADGKISGDGDKRLLITNEYTNRLVHRWRSEEAAILVGTNTALKDDPSLTNRLWTGKSPVRLLLDLSLRVPGNANLYDDAERTIIFNARKEEEHGNIRFHKIDRERPATEQIVEAAYQYGLQSLIVEGGAHLLQSFIGAGLWDEARIITNTTRTVGEGLSSPLLTQATLIRQERMAEDHIACYQRTP